MNEKHSYEEIRKPYVYQEYPKVLYRHVANGERGDVTTPGYPKVVKPIGGGDAYLEPQYLSHVTVTVRNSDEEQAFKQRGFSESLQSMEVVVEEPKRGPGRPRKQIEAE